MPDHASAVKSLESRRILAVDDSPAIRKVIAGVLKSEFSVKTACDGQEALTLIEAWRPDVIVSDLHMPELSGLELVEQLKSDPRYQRIPFILLTSDQDSDSAVQCLDLGADFHLRKPIAAGELRARVRAAIRQQEMVQQIEASHRELEETHRILLETQSQLVQAQKLEAIGRLAAGIAHEINTPLQYVGDNVVFMRDAFQAIAEVYQHFKLLAQERHDAQIGEGIREFEARREELDLDFYLEEIPQAIDQSLSGIESLTQIVCAMKEFSHPGGRDKIASDVNQAIRNTILVCRNEWKYLAEIELELDPSLPLVALHPGEFNQVLLNLVVNAAHAIEDRQAKLSSSERGTIQISTHSAEDEIEIRIQDTGCGIPSSIQDKIYEPFFTTKPIGRGTGQGLAIARSVIVDKHQGRIEFSSTSTGTQFTVRLPLRVDSESEREFLLDPADPPSCP